ncbi:MAG: hypothetical protein EBR85_07370 [Betaproteobacteria bacterium]|jgi:hypothetical protein|nr:hypothetical protein [Betaproteobacteria bacterium]
MMSSHPDHPISEAGSRASEHAAQEVRRLMHELMNQLEIISGCAHLVGLHPALGTTERDDIQRILSAVGQSRALAQDLGQRLISPGQ